MVACNLVPSRADVGRFTKHRWIGRVWTTEIQGPFWRSAAGQVPAFLRCTARLADNSTADLFHRIAPRRSGVANKKEALAVSARIPVEDKGQQGWVGWHAGHLTCWRWQAVSCIYYGAR